MAEPLRKTDKIYTYKDYASWPQDERWELIEGTAWNMSPAPGTRHQIVLRSLFLKIGNYLAGKKCSVFVAPFDVFLPESNEQEEGSVTTVVQPDLSIVCDKNKIREKGCFGPPDWVIEILSPYTSKKDLNEKFFLYEKYRVAEYWVVDPGNKFIHVYLLGENGQYGDPNIFLGNAVVSGTVCDDLTITLDEVWDE